MKTPLSLARLIKIDMKRAFKSNGFLLSIAISGIISITHVIVHIIPVYQDGWPMPVSLFARWIGGEGYSFFTQLLFLIFPIISILPYGASYFDDRKSGYLKQLYLRANKQCVLLSKCVVAFLSGMIATMFPLTLNLMISAMIYPALVPQPSTMMFTPTNTGFMCRIFVLNPWQYCLVYILIIAVFYGCFSCIGLACGTFFKKRVFVLGFPFVIYLALCTLSSLFNINNPMYIFHPAQIERASGAILAIYITIIIIPSIIIYFVRGMRSETY